MLVPYVVQLETVGGSVPGTQTPAEWRTRGRANAPAHGKPTAESLKAYVARFEASTKEGGVNAHVGPVTVVSAFIKDQRSGEIKATYRPLTQVQTQLIQTATQAGVGVILAKTGAGKA